MEKNTAPISLVKLSGHLSYRSRAVLLYFLVLSLTFFAPLSALASAFVEFSVKDCQVSCCGQEKKSCCCEESPAQPNNLEAKVVFPSAPKFVPIKGTDNSLSEEACDFLKVVESEYSSEGVAVLPQSQPLYILNRALLI